MTPQNSTDTKVVSVSLRLLLVGLVVMKIFDKDGDGRVTKEEIVAGIEAENEAEHKDITLAWVDKEFPTHDGDSDGFLTAEEFQSLLDAYDEHAAKNEL